MSFSAKALHSAVTVGEWCPSPVISFMELVWWPSPPKDVSEGHLLGQRMREPLVRRVVYEEHRDIGYIITGESRENARNWGVRGTSVLPFCNDLVQQVLGEPN